ncbi:polysaccharide deacetylase family protein [Pseudarthrobacter sp. SSS035]|uniref:polysaccharide deacetylase family protein n=1 Tax=Pseudarthrobacter sp. SSS035 TaxID=2931399 RepID=UPI00200BBD58|nr:polysaccharide deacetylase family protein [Pseudarthrobacter sp. SSS035]
MRDLIGYGEQPPRGSWPNGARVAISVVVNFEEGAERSIAAGDEADEDVYVFGGWKSDPAKRSLMKESYFEYGSRVGIWRILSLLRRHQVPATVMACGMALEKSPEVGPAIVRDGHEICAHGYRWAGTVGMDPREELAEIRRCAESIERMAGVRPVGWYVRDGITENTRSLLAAEGFLYDSNSYSDDLPYFVSTDLGPHLVVPYTSDANDGRFWGNASLATGNELFEVCRDTLDFLLSEDDGVPRMMSLGIHTRIGGRPSVARGIQQFLQYAVGREDVWFATREQIARWWIDAAGDQAVETSAVTLA